MAKIYFVPPLVISDAAMVWKVCQQLCLEAGEWHQAVLP